MQKQVIFRLFMSNSKAQRIASRLLCTFVTWRKMVFLSDFAFVVDSLLVIILCVLPRHWVWRRRRLCSSPMEDCWSFAVCGSHGSSHHLQSSSSPILYSSSSSSLQLFKEGETSRAGLLPSLVENCIVPLNGKICKPVADNVRIPAFAKPQPMSV